MATPLYSDAWLVMVAIGTAKGADCHSNCKFVCKTLVAVFFVISLYLNLSDYDKNGMAMCFNLPFDWQLSTVL